MLELKNVSFSVGSADDELEIIDDISITFDDGKFVVITGPNGRRKIHARKAHHGHRAADRGTDNL